MEVNNKMADLRYQAIPAQLKQGDGTPSPPLLVGHFDLVSNATGA